MVQGLYTPLPPCLSVPVCSACLEESACCRKCGTCGSESCRDNRANLMLFAAFLSFLGLVLQIVAVVGTSTKDMDVINTAWTVHNGDLIDSYVGLNEVVVCVDGERDNDHCHGFGWDDTACPESFTHCDECKDACDATIMTSITSVITAIPQFTTDIQRSTIAGDVNCQKVFGVLTGCLGFLLTLSSLATYADGCHNNLPDGYEFGPGFVCILIATLLKPLDVLFHAILPVPKSKTKDHYRVDNWTQSMEFTDGYNQF